MPLLLRSTIDLVRCRFISLGLQKLVHVRTLNKMTTTACHAFLTVDGIEPSDVEKLKTLNFDRYPDPTFPFPLCAVACSRTGMPVCLQCDLVLIILLCLQLGRLSLHDAAWSLSRARH